MGKHLTLIIFVVLMPFLNSKAHTGHPHPAPATPKVTPDEICVSQNSEICAHVHFAKAPNSIEEAPFVLHFETLNDVPVQNLKVELWMEMEGGHGHGSAPVAMKSMTINKYQISNVWFVMMGTWLVKTHFDLNGVQYKLNIPVNIYQ